MKKRIVFMWACVIALLMWLPTDLQKKCLSQRRESERGYVKRFQHINLVDMPTGGLLAPATFDAGLRMYTEGGLLGRLSVGVTDRFMFGVSFGGTNVIGAGEVDWNINPGVNAKYFLMEEGLNRPAIALGFDSQGYGPYYKTYTEIIKTDHGDSLRVLPDVNRYAIKSRGFYLVISKGYFFWRNFGLHLGINRSLEADDKDTDPTIFLGFDIDLGSDVSFVCEYDFATNDDGPYTIGQRRKGYLNAGLRWSFMERVYVEFDFKDILGNEEPSSEFGRVIKIAYIQPLKQ